MSSTKEELSNIRKQAFYDSHNLYKKNVEKYAHTSDTILQQKERYVRFIYIITFNRKQKNTKPILNLIIISKKWIWKNQKYHDQKRHLFLRMIA